MNRPSKLRFDKIGYWSEIKLDIVRKYGTAYSTILSALGQHRFYHIYIDAFAGAGVHISKTTGGFVLGSPLNALNINPPFREYHFIDLDRRKVAALKTGIGGRSNAYVYSGDCNSILQERVFPRVRYEHFRRALCLLDPYGLHLQWKIIQTAGGMKSIDMLLNFPVADMNRNILWRNPEGVDGADIARMDAFWGDRSWRDIAYRTNGNLFGYPEKEENETVAEAFRQRLRTVAEFERVARPLAMRNSRGSIVYYLFLASQKSVAEHIIEEIFEKYRDRGK